MSISSTVTIKLKAASQGRSSRPQLKAASQERLERYTNARKLKPDFLIAVAVEQYLDRQEKREKFLKDGVAAWEDYQATTLHPTGEELESRLAQLEAGEGGLLPECHAAWPVPILRAALQVA